MNEMRSGTLEAQGLRIHYREAGEGEPVLLLHGWPTSSHLWRGVMPGIAAAGSRVIAPDLPGFGRSDKPLSASYSLRFHERVLEDFLAQLRLDRIGLAVHDLGGPIGLFWACRHPERLRSLALLNTLVYPELSWAAVAFVTAARLPGLRSLVTTPWFLRKTLEIGVRDRGAITAETVAAVQAPFESREARRVLAKAGCNISPRGLEEIAEKLPTLTCPVRIVYGARDRVLPDVAKTMARVQRDLPQAETTVLEDCGHFLQEERPEEIGRLLGDFFSATSAS